MHAMVRLWVIFGLALFVFERRIVGTYLERPIASQSAKTIPGIEVLHWVLLVLSLVVVAAGVAGAHGW